MRRQRLLRLLEVLGLDMGGPGVAIAERLGQRVLRRVVHAAEPVEPQAARLGAGRPGELAGDLGPLVGVLGQYSEPRGNEDHRQPQSRCAGTPLSPEACARGEVPGAVTRSVRCRPGPGVPLLIVLVVSDFLALFEYVVLW